MYTIHHVGIYSSDIGRSEEFYAKLGFKRTITTKVSIFLENGGNAGIQLFKSKATGDDKREPGLPGFRHVCFESEDVQADYERLRDSIEFIREPSRHENVLFTLCLDPDGVEVELLQELEEYSVYSSKSNK